MSSSFQVTLPDSETRVLNKAERLLLNRPCSGRAIDNDIPETDIGCCWFLLGWF